MPAFAGLLLKELIYYADWVYITHIEYITYAHMHTHIYVI